MGASEEHQAEPEQETGTRAGQGPTPPPAGPLARADVLAALACVALGLTLAVLPHLATLWQYGTPEFLADNDDTAYLAIARAPYYGERALRDPFLGRWEQAPPSLYPWALFAPLARLTRLMGLPLIMLGLLWRALGGALLGGALFLLFRRILAPTRHPAAWALGCAVVCLSDAGFVGGRMIVQTFALLPHFRAGTTPLAKPDVLAQYRVVTPLLNLPFLLMLAATLVPSRSLGRRSVPAVLTGAVLLACCVVLFFYFWTAAVGAIGMYLLGLLVVAWRWPDRREAALAQARFVAAVLVLGLLMGSPQILSNARTFGDPKYRDILARMFKPYRLPPGDPIRFAFIKNGWAWGKLAIGVFGLLALRLPNLGLPWCLTLAGYLLANSALVTGMEFENSHWAYVHSPFGEVVVLSVLCLGADRRGWAGRGPGKALFWAVPLVMAAIALAWRPYEALHAPEAAENSRILAELQPLRPALAKIGPEHSLAGPKAANCAILYSRSALLYHSPYSWTFSLVPEADLHERNALNAWLRGLDLDQYRRTAGKDSNVIYGRPEWSEEAIRSARVPIFEDLSADPPRLDVDALMTRLRPDYLLLPSTAPRPTRGGPWRPVNETAEWSLWSRVPASEPESDRAGEATP